MNPLFTIGHSTYELDRLIESLKKHAVEVVVDVRSNPISNRFPHFSREPLKTRLAEYGMQYVFLGKELGARRIEREVYEGHVASYERIAKLRSFAEGLERLRIGAISYRISLLCAEKDPLQCHRTILVCRHLRHEFTNRIFHIVEAGALEAHEDAEARLVAEVGLDTRQADIFSEGGGEGVLDRAYRKRGLAIAYQEQSHGDQNLYNRVH